MPLPPRPRRARPYDRPRMAVDRGKDCAISASESALITGQIGSYLAELLLGKACAIHGIILRSSSFKTERLDHIHQDPHVPELNLFLHYGDLSDASKLTDLLREGHRVGRHVVRKQAFCGRLGSDVRSVFRAVSGSGPMFGGKTCCTSSRN